MNRAVVTVDAYGQHRTGPAGAWWSNLTPRSAGMSPELPAARAAVWNLSLVGFVALSAFLTHFLAGAPWSQIGAVLGGAVVLGLALGVLAFRAARYRDPWQRYLRAKARAEARAVEPRRVLPVRATGEAT